MRECCGLANRQTGRREYIDGGLDGALAQPLGTTQPAKMCVDRTKSRVGVTRRFAAGGGKVR